MKRIALLIALIVLFAVNALAQSNVTPPAPPPSPAPSPALVSASPSANPPGTETTSTTDTKAPATAAAPAAKGSVILPPEKANPVTIPKFEKPPTIDGILNEPVWQGPAVLKDFYQINPGDNTAPSKPTEVLIGYDSKFLYIAFRAFDEPDKIRSTIAKRDNIWQDDYVGFYLDTFNDKRKAFEMFFNPLGIQGDGVLTEGRGEDMSVDLLMDSKGIIGDSGYVVEIAIPFKSLRYEAGKGKLWGAHFFRRIKRNNNELDSWMPFSRAVSSNLSQAGHLTGLDNISTERTLELIPSLTLSQTGRRVRSFSPPAGIDQGRIVNQPIELEPGLTAKFGISPTMTLDL